MGVPPYANDPASQSILPNSQTVTMLLCRAQLDLAPNRTPFEDSGTCHPRHPVQHSTWACQPDRCDRKLSMAEARTKASSSFNIFSNIASAVSGEIKTIASTARIRTIVLGCLRVAMCRNN